MRAVLRWTAVGAGLLLVLTAGLCLASYRKFSANITTDKAAEQVLAGYAAQRPPALVPQAWNILVMGADGADGAAGEEPGAEADAAVLLHLSADRTRATAVGVPRGLRVGVPGCHRPGGGTAPAAYEPFAAAFRAGGAACSIRAFEQLSGVRVDHHLVVDVPRFGRIADAVGGGSGDGPGDPRGDLLRALSGAARGGGSLAHPARLFGLLDSATSAITADPGLSSLPALYGLAGTLRRLPADRVTLVTLPTAPGAGDVLRRTAADRLFAALRADRPLRPAPDP
ncbi:LCP family protein [Streptomyces sp. NPDC049040]|uniref:LCP family glycopolymer transferase n=1 Tax=Streptomyces sp. NPDC049040 TaxID=3365593 RepID=UPI00372418F2